MLIDKGTILIFYHIILKRNKDKFMNLEKKKILRKISIFAYDKKNFNKRLVKTKKSIDEIKKLF
ncbi:hypothetical protein DWV06_09000 [Anaerosacchariphilus polymeriproducens]|uniref:Uncharacterized protein n=1 Tax=Anaerosacchariphilus polymeriproducens TaxID=1812858 RepID=A0A371AVF4_9FIRM|nr:hypothetical protein DWV06_09000 [Anaerosacchariphilus polymeriproducens]